MFRSIVSVALVCALALGCSGGGDDDFSPVACDAGRTEACTCDDGNAGAQVCNSDGKAWGKCSCASANNAGAGPGGGSSGASSQKDCTADSDCPTKTKPYCVDWACVAPATAAAGDPCGHAIECDSSTYCASVTGDTSEPSYCVVKKSTGRDCANDAQCISGKCTGVCL
jgi:hypothetical protein